MNKLHKIIKRRSFLKKIGLISASFPLASLPLSEGCRRKEKPPNIILIFTDDQGYADVGCFGAKGFSTPNLDRMAEEGKRFTQFYVSQAVCSASRASLLTGCYSERVGIQGALSPWSRTGLNTEEETIAKILKRKGYATACFGKWHLGHELPFLPLQNGFDEYLGLPYSNDMWPVGYDGKPVTKGRKLFYPLLSLIDGNQKTAEIRTLEDQASLTTLYTERAVRFIEKNKKHPFFLYLPHSMPHVPLAVSNLFKGKSPKGLYGDVIMEIDWSAGQILDTLKRLGLEKNTLVIFTSDNGPWLNFGEHAGSANPLREGKGTAWEGGVRVPCIMRWPSFIPPSTVCNLPAATIDLLPTIAAVTGAPLPQKKIDGVNILPLLEGKTEISPRDSYYYYYNAGLRAVRRGKWKLVFPHISRSYEEVEPGQGGYPGGYTFPTWEMGLYDLIRDPAERNNLASEHPEIIQDLNKLAEKARRELGDALTGCNGSEVRPPGRIYGNRPRSMNNLASGKKIFLKPDPNPNYSKGGASSLIDGLLGSEDHRDERWLGFEKNGFDAVIDLGTEHSFQEISCGCLQNQVSWIFFPAEIQFFTSTDGIHYDQVGRLTHTPELNPIPETRDFRVFFPPVYARWIKVKVKNIGFCPIWHPGAGGEAWVFADEIIIR
ncbi:MAG: sulfatase-like hydrolase/transferase [Candidatus Aminicenantes bacterium]|nr:sulfatase-like hydrolase/transferase [Candidatus Aminicenantes bacterium]